MGSAADKPSITSSSGGRVRVLLTILLMLVSAVVGYRIALLSDFGREFQIGARTLPMTSIEHPPDIDPADLITVRSQDQARRARERLIEVIWGTADLPDTLPRVEPSILDSQTAAFVAPLVTKTETLVVDMGDGMVARAVHFVPATGNGTVVILHEGHDGSVLSRRDVIRTLLSNGFAVIALSMPLLPPNSQPDLTLPTGEVIKLVRHQRLRFLAPERGHAIRYFLEPVTEVINYVVSSTSYRKICMLGVSGGGWTTVLSAAVDPRIELSIPVAGSFPLYLRTLPQDLGDWEESLPEIFAHVGYLDLYVLGSAGCGRGQTPIYYEHDSCCYAGHAPKTFEPAVEEASREIGGSFDVTIDTEYAGHGYSPAAMKQIVELLSSFTGQPCQ